jgi:hypothetical protein
MDLKRKIPLQAPVFQQLGQYSTERKPSGLYIHTYTWTQVGINIGLNIADI